MINENKLDEIAMDYAIEIRREIKDHGGEETELAHEYADGSEWAIYYHKAHELCRECDVTSGEDGLRDGGEPLAGWSYDTMATTIAYWELNTRILLALSDMED